MTYRHFTRGSSTFNCAVCNRLTRRVNQAGECCPQCDEIAMIDNMVNDNGYEPGSKDYADALAECEGLLAEIEAKGGKIKTVREQNEYIWRD